MDPSGSRVGELDEVALARAQRGDRVALGRVIEVYEDRVFRLLRRMLFQSPSDVEDVAQEVFVKVIKGLKGFDPRGPAPLSGWILTIAARTAIDQIRKRRPNEPIPEAAFDGVAAMDLAAEGRLRYFADAHVIPRGSRSACPRWRRWSARRS